MRRIIICIMIAFACLLCVAAYVEAQHLTPYPVQNTSRSKGKVYSQFYGYDLNCCNLLSYAQQKKIRVHKGLKDLKINGKDSVIECCKNGVRCAEKCVCSKCGKSFCIVKDSKKYPDCKGLKRAVNGVCPYCGAPISESCDTICNHNGNCNKPNCKCTDHKHIHNN